MTTTDRGYCVADWLRYLYLLEIKSESVEEVLIELDKAMVAQLARRSAPPPTWRRTVI